MTTTVDPRGGDPSSSPAARPMAKSVNHMPLWAILLAPLGGTAVFGALAVRTFRNRVLN